MINADTVLRSSNDQRRIARMILERRRAERRARGDDEIPRPTWSPNPPRPDGSPNPQALARDCAADELFYGGQAGGGKTFLTLGLAFTEHQKSAIFRRVFPNLKEVIRKSYEIMGRDEEFGRYNKKEKEWILHDGRSVEFGSVQYEDDKTNWQGRDHDLKAFDEITEFTRTQYLFIIGWNRSTDPEQRVRVVVTGNPPIDEAGSWVIDEWGPWLVPDHPHRAEPGELRWYYYDDDDHLRWQDTDDPVVVGGEEHKPKSRTFIPAELDDNPHLSGDGQYRGRIQSMPQEIRRVLMGDFQAGLKADPWQVIPTAWVKAAQRRWLERRRPVGAPLTAVGVDVVRGGSDEFALAKRYGTWFAPIKKLPGAKVEDGPKAAGIVYHEIENEEHLGTIYVDVLGVGSSAYDSLKAMYPGKVVPVNASAKSSYVAYTKEADPKPLFRMRNVRAEYHWRMREALDPVHGDGLALPPGDDLLADLCSARYDVQAGGVIKVELKDNIRSRLGRSPDAGEAVMLSYMETDAIDLSELDDLGTLADFQHWTR